MRYKEFAPRKKNNNQKVDEVLPALAAGAAKALGGAALRGIGSAALRGAGSAVGSLARGVGSAVGGAARNIGSIVRGAQTANRISNLATSSTSSRPTTATSSQPTTTTRPTSQPAASQNTQAQQPIPLKVGSLVPMANPIGQVKINKIEPHSVTLDTQSKLGMNLKVDPAELGNYMQTVQGKIQK